MYNWARVKTNLVLLGHQNFPIVFQKVGTHLIEIIATSVFVDQIQGCFWILIQSSVLNFLLLPGVGVVLYVESELRRNTSAPFSTLNQVLHYMVIPSLRH